MPAAARAGGTVAGENCVQPGCRTACADAPVADPSNSIPARATATRRHALMARAAARLHLMFWPATLCSEMDTHALRALQGEPANCLVILRSPQSAVQADQLYLGPLKSNAPRREAPLLPGQTPTRLGIVPLSRRVDLQIAIGGNGRLPGCLSRISGAGSSLLIGESLYWGWKFTLFKAGRIVKEISPSGYRNLGILVPHNLLHRRPKPASVRLGLARGIPERAGGDSSCMEPFGAPAARLWLRNESWNRMRITAVLLLLASVGLLPAQ